MSDAGGVVMIALLSFILGVWLVVGLHPSRRYDRRSPRCGAQYPGGYPGDEQCRLLMDHRGKHRAWLEGDPPKKAVVWKHY